MEANKQSLFVGKVRRLQNCEKIYGVRTSTALMLYEAIFDMYTTKEESIPLLYALKVECIKNECLGLANELDTFILSTGAAIPDGLHVLNEALL